MCPQVEGESAKRKVTGRIYIASRFNPYYRGLTDKEKYMYGQVKELAAGLEGIFYEFVPDCPERAAALTRLEEAIMWAIKGLTSNPPNGHE